MYSDATNLCKWLIIVMQAHLETHVDVVEQLLAVMKTVVEQLLAVMKTELSLQCQLECSSASNSDSPISFVHSHCKYLLLSQDVPWYPSAYILRVLSLDTEIARKYDDGRRGRCNGEWRRYFVG